MAGRQYGNQGVGNNGCDRRIGAIGFATGVVITGADNTSVGHLKSQGSIHKFASLASYSLDPELDTINLHKKKPVSPLLPPGVHEYTTEVPTHA